MSNDTIQNNGTKHLLLSYACLSIHNQTSQNDEKNINFKRIRLNFLINHTKLCKND